MILFSQMHNIISSTAVSFSSGNVLHVKNNSIERDQAMFKYKRWETTPLNDFRFLVIYLVYKHNANKFDIFRMLNEITKEELQAIQKIKEKLVLYKKSIIEEISFVKTKIINPGNIIKMYTKNEISEVGYYYFMWHFNRIGRLSRIQDKKLRQIMMFMDYFPVIKNYIATIYERNNLEK